MATWKLPGFFQNRKFRLPELGIELSRTWRCLPENDGTHFTAIPQDGCDSSIRMVDALSFLSLHLKIAKITKGNTTRGEFCDWKNSFVASCENSSWSAPPNVADASRGRRWRQDAGVRTRSRRRSLEVRKRSRGRAPGGIQVLAQDAQGCTLEACAPPRSAARPLTK